MGLIGQKKVYSSARSRFCRWPYVLDLYRIRAVQPSARASAFFNPEHTDADDIAATSMAEGPQRSPSDHIFDLVSVACLIVALMPGNAHCF